MSDQDEPPIRLILSALFLAARRIGKENETALPEQTKVMVSAAVADADELLRQVPP